MKTMLPGSHYYFPQAFPEPALIISKSCPNAFKHFYMKKFTLFFGVIFCLSCHSRKQTPTTDLQNILATGKWIDLTYSFSEETLYWPSVSTTFQLDTVYNGQTPGGYFYSAYSYSAPEHGGTHLDAPVHFAQGKLAADEIDIEQLTGSAVVIDITNKVKSNKDYLISIQDVEAWETKYGKIPDGSIVLFKTGFGKYYSDAAAYLGTTEKGEKGIANLHFPGIDPALSEWLVKNRKIKAVGLDTASVDYGQSKDFRTHQILYAANIIGFENVANLDKLPETGAYVFALPMKIKGGSGAPLRIIAWMK
jgi:kynurenine formamidase